LYYYYHTRNLHSFPTRRSSDLMDISVHANYDAVCFHAQQCAEKYLKACLQEADLPFRKTHDLSELLHSLLSVHPQFQSLQEDLKDRKSTRLNSSHVAISYAVFC